MPLFQDLRIPCLSCRICLPSALCVQMWKWRPDRWQRPLCSSCSTTGHDSGRTGHHRSRRPMHLTRAVRWLCKCSRCFVLMCMTSDSWMHSCCCDESHSASHSCPPLSHSRPSPPGNQEQGSQHTLLQLLLVRGPQENGQVSQGNDSQGQEVREASPPPVLILQPVGCQAKRGSTDRWGGLDVSASLCPAGVSTIPADGHAYAAVAVAATSCTAAPCSGCPRPFPRGVASRECQSLCSGGDPIFASHQG